MWKTAEVATITKHDNSQVMNYASIPLVQVNLLASQKVKRGGSPTAMAAWQDVVLELQLIQMGKPPGVPAAAGLAAPGLPANSSSSILGPTPGQITAAAAAGKPPGKPPQAAARGRGADEDDEEDEFEDDEDEDGDEDEEEDGGPRRKKAKQRECLLQVVVSAAHSLPLVPG